MQTIDPGERLSVQIVEDLLRDCLAQSRTNPHPKKCGERESEAEACGLYIDLKGKKRLWTTRELCEFTGWHPEQVYRLIQREGLPAHRFRKRGHFRFFPGEIAEWMRKRDCNPGVPAELPDRKAGHASADPSRGASRRNLPAGSCRDAA